MASELDLKSAIQLAGGPESAARLCGITPGAIYKWITLGRLPRTDYTGETNYAAMLAAASNGAYTAETLREQLRPNKSAA